MPNHRGKTVLHEAIRANNAECVHTLLATYPKSELLPAAIMQDNEGRTVLHYLAREHNLSGIKLILSSYGIGATTGGVYPKCRWAEYVALCYRVATM